jgi:hypothetical protein
MPLTRMDQIEKIERSNDGRRHSFPALTWDEYDALIDTAKSYVDIREPYGKLLVSHLDRMSGQK